MCVFVRSSTPHEPRSNQLIVRTSEQSIDSIPTPLSLLSSRGAAEYSETRARALFLDTDALVLEGFEKGGAEDGTLGKNSALRVALDALLVLR